MTLEVALITGCGSGIGKALARELHSQITESGERRFTVYATDYREDALSELADEGMRIARMDVTSSSNIQEVVDSILKEHHHIDLLVCNAGIVKGGFLAEQDYDDIERVFDVNVHGVFRVVQAVAPHMLARRKGRIATMCSVISYFAQPFNAAYAGTKGAVERMTETLAMELEPFGVSVTSIIPGWVRTGIEHNSQTDFDRYATEESHYNTIIELFRTGTQKLAAQGMTAEQAAGDIAKGLTKPKAPRFLYTGQSVWVVMFHAIAQNSFLNMIANRIHIISVGMGPLWKRNAEKKRMMASGEDVELPLKSEKDVELPLKSEKDVELPLKSEKDIELPLKSEKAE